MSRRNLGWVIGGVIMGVTAVVVAELIRRVRSREEWTADDVDSDRVADTREPAMR